LPLVCARQSYIIYDYYIYTYYILYLSPFSSKRN
jgi:hypothetical protein